MENILPYVLTATPNVLSIGRRCRHDGFGFYWEPFAKVPRVVAPDGSPIPVEVFGDIPYFRDTINLSLREEHRGEDAVPAPSLKGNLQRRARKQCDAGSSPMANSSAVAKSSPVTPAADDPIEDDIGETDPEQDPNLAEMVGT